MIISDFLFVLVFLVVFIRVALSASKKTGQTHGSDNYYIHFKSFDHILQE